MNITEPEQAFNSSQSLNKTGRFWVQEQTDNVQAAIVESQGKFETIFAWDFNQIAYTVKCYYLSRPTIT